MGERRGADLTSQGPATGPLAVLKRAVPGVVRVIGPDRHIAMEGEDRDTIIGVLSGLLRCYRMTVDGRRHVARFVRPGGLIGLGALAAFRSTVEAVTTSAIVEFRVHALDVAAGDNASIRQATMQAMTAELLTRDRVQFRLGRLWADERVADFVLELAGIMGAGGKRTITLQMSRADIADHLGVTIETVSRALSRFQSEGFIRLDNPHHFSILNHAALQALAMGDGESHLIAARRSDPCAGDAPGRITEASS